MRLGISYRCQQPYLLVRAMGNDRYSSCVQQTNWLGRYLGPPISYWQLRVLVLGQKYRALDNRKADPFG